ncbi:MAG: nucleoside hydrolase [Acidobacteria bacterium]|nr:nucleoside hydrolase [Acidobacteriota bacterium]
MPRTIIHLDTDIGGDTDDLCALALVLAWPGAELLAVTTVSDDGGRRAGYARYALGLAGRAGVPVAAGADVSLGCYSPVPGFPKSEDAYWPEPVSPAPGSHETALDLLERSIERGAVVAAIGPFTNLALLERRRPGILRDARLCLMGGHFLASREGFPRWDFRDDWNIQVDAASALYVFERSSPTLVPLSATAETMLTRSQLPALRRAPSPLARLVARQAEAFASDEGLAERYVPTYAGVPEDFINFQHDPLACAVALGWDEGAEVCELPVKLEVIDRFLRQRVEEGGRMTRVLTKVDGARFGEFWLDAVTGAAG